MRLMEEELMANLLERITINPDQCGGRPCIRGMRIRVIDVFYFVQENRKVKIGPEANALIH